MRFGAILLILFCLSSCTASVYAPVTDVSVIEQIPGSGRHIVSPGETLYSIAWRYGLDYRYLARLNHIPLPYHIRVGQVIYLRNPGSKIIKFNTPSSVRVVGLPVNEPVTLLRHWQWPAQGPIVGNFAGLNKGINIAGKLGDPIYATAKGRVVYCNNGLRGYGNLIIIKHNSSFLSAYAHNTRVLVREGDVVRSGQKIAEMGNTGSKQVMLHFEIRQNGQPVNPLLYLNRR